MKANVELRTNETIIKHVKGDKYTGWFIFKERTAGEWIFTNERVIFYAKSLLGDIEEEIVYKDIAQIKKCLTPPCFPFGIKVTTKQGKKTTLALVGRAKYITLLENAMNSVPEIA